MKLLYLPSLQAWLLPGFFFFSSEQKPKSPFFHFVKPLLSRCCSGTKVVHLDTEIHNRTRNICKGREQESSRALSLNMKCMCYRGSWKCRPWSFLGKTPGNLFLLRGAEIESITVLINGLWVSLASCLHGLAGAGQWQVSGLLGRHSIRVSRA